MSGDEDKKKVPPGSPPETPVREPQKEKTVPKGDPVPPDKKEPRQ
ncbi:MAG: hypothetical protein V4598_05425 [Bdellovibrionota bacterium]